MKLSNFWIPSIWDCMSLRKSFRSVQVWSMTAILFMSTLWRPLKDAIFQQVLWTWVGDLEFCEFLPSIYFLVILVYLFYNRSDPKLSLDFAAFLPLSWSSSFLDFSTANLNPFPFRPDQYGRAMLERESYTRLPSKFVFFWTTHKHAPSWYPKNILSCLGRCLRWWK